MDDLLDQIMDVVNRDKRMVKPGQGIEPRGSQRMADVITACARAAGLDIAADRSAYAIIQPDSSYLMPLLISAAERDIVCVSHYYLWNGDRVPDPEIAFLTRTPKGMGWVPVWIKQQQDMRVATEVSARSTILRFDPREQADQAAFADQWADNIAQQGYLAAASTPAHIDHGDEFGDE